MIECTLKKIKEGKVRDIYEAIPKHKICCELLGMVTTDRVSANDKVIGEIPGRGRLLNQITIFWKETLAKEKIINNDLFTFCIDGNSEDNLTIVKKAKAIPSEIIVRAILTGSMYEKYLYNNELAGEYLGVYLPEGMKEWDVLPKISVTPTTKAPVGCKDESIQCDDLIEIIEAVLDDKENRDMFSGYFCKYPEEYLMEIYDKSIRIFKFASKYLFKKGIILVDTKFEFGFVKNGEDIELILIDEVLTPDSSRFISKDDYAKGVITHMSKQTLRNWIANYPDTIIPNDIKEKVLEEYELIHRAILF